MDTRAHPTGAARAALGNPSPPAGRTITRQRTRRRGTLVDAAAKNGAVAHKPAPGIHTREPQCLAAAWPLRGYWVPGICDRNARTRRVRLAAERRGAISEREAPY